MQKLFRLETKMNVKKLKKLKIKKCFKQQVHRNVPGISNFIGIMQDNRINIAHNHLCQSENIQNINYSNKIHLVGLHTFNKCKFVCLFLFTGLII